VRRIFVNDLVNVLLELAEARQLVGLVVDHTFDGGDLSLGGLSARLLGELHGVHPVLLGHPRNSADRIGIPSWVQIRPLFYSAR